MNSIAALGIFFIFVGCTSAPPRLNCDEACAMQNMVCVGQTIGETDGSSTVMPKPGDSLKSIINPQTVNHSSSTTSYHCVKDDTKSEKIQELRLNVSIKRDRRLFESKCNSPASVLNGSIKRVCDKWRAKMEKQKSGLSTEDRKWKCQPGRMATDSSLKKQCEGSEEDLDD